MTNIILAAVIASLALATGESKNYDDRVTVAGAANLKGTWATVGMEAMGKKAAEEQYKGNVLTLDGTKASHKDKDKTEHATYKIDATKKPAELDITLTEGPDKNTVMKMIFQLDGDTLKLAGKLDGKERPKNFEEKDLIIITLKREKK